MPDTSHYHSNLNSIHKGAYVQAVDPGPVGADRLWVERVGLPPYPIHVRTAANDDWEDTGGIGTGSAGAFVQGGNAYGAMAVLGTTDNQDLSIMRNGVEYVRGHTDGLYMRKHLAVGPASYVDTVPVVHAKDFFDGTGDAIGVMGEVLLTSPSPHNNWGIAGLMQLNHAGNVPEASGVVGGGSTVLGNADVLASVRGKTLTSGGGTLGIAASLFGERQNAGINNYSGYFVGDVYMGGLVKMADNTGLVRFLMNVGNPGTGDVRYVGFDATAGGAGHRGFFQFNWDGVDSNGGYISYDNLGIGFQDAINFWNNGTKLTNYTAASDFGLPFDCTSANLTCVLPGVTSGGAAAVGDGRVYLITKVDPSAHTLTIAAAAGEQIDGAATLVMGAQASVLIISDTTGGTGHWVVLMRGVGPGGGTGPTTLGALTDVGIASPANGETLQYAASDGKWHNTPASVARTNLGLGSLATLDNVLTSIDDLLLGGAGGVQGRLPRGADGYVLLVNPATHHVEWGASPSGFADPMTTKGDLIARGASTTRLGVGANGQMLMADSAQATGIKWAFSTLPNMTDVSIAAPADLNLLQYQALDSKWHNVAGITPAQVAGFDAQVRSSTLNQMTAPTADLSMNTHKLTGVVDPGSAQDAATKHYVDTAVAGGVGGGSNVVNAAGRIYASATFR